MPKDQKTQVFVCKEHKIRLPQFLEKKTKKGFSQKKWKRILENNCVRVNGQIERFASTDLFSGDVVEILLQEEWEKPSLLYEDDYLVIWNKPRGIVSQEVCAQYTLVHRLDKETSGALLFGKTSEVAVLLEELFRLRTIKKEYIAVVDGIVTTDQGTITSRIQKKQERIFVSSSQGAYAKTAYKVLKRSKQATLVALFPITGKTHQLRLHMQDLGHPILGDYHYARKRGCNSFPATRLLLHALKLSFFHPVTKKRLTTKAPLPKSFLRDLEKIFPKS
ncbi:MAG: RluA family pseudouridine synthase [Chlamydiota bacterium]